jgi:two-component system heavy metal sensor histidine kinase CusS
MKSLTARLTIWYAIAATATAAVFMFFGRVLVEESYVNGMDFLNDNEFKEIQVRIEQQTPRGSNTAAIKAIRQHTERNASLFFFQVGHSHEETFFVSDNLGGHELPHKVHRERRITVETPELGRLRVGEYTSGGFDIHIASSLQNFATLEKDLFRIAVISLVTIFLMSIAIGYILSRFALRPIVSIQNTASRISSKTLDERINVPNTGDEVARLADFLNTMFDRLESSFTQVQRFTADVSHELNTPLSLIRLHAEELLNKPDTDNQKRSQILTNQIELIDSLNKVVKDLLILAKADAGVLKLSLNKLNTHTLIEDFAQDASALCEDKGLTLELENKFRGSIFCDSTWMRHLLFNLLSNAMRFSPQGCTIRIISEKENSDWKISLIDQGPGITADKLGRVFERFYNEQDPQGGKGSGLGLSLCRSIAQLHGGTLTLSNRSSGTGLVATLRLPLQANA